MFLIVGCGFGNDTNNTSTSEEAEAEGSDGTTIDVMEASEVATLDSSHAHASVGFSTLNNINEGLYRGDENHEPELAVAEEHDVSDDETVHTFTFRDANWSNGAKITAKDCEYAWKRTVDVAGHYSDMFVTANVKNAQAILDEEMGSEDLGVEAIDENTLEVTLESPNPLFKQLLTFP